MSGFEDEVKNNIAGDGRMEVKREPLAKDYLAYYRVKNEIIYAVISSKIKNIDRIINKIEQLVLDGSQEGIIIYY